MIFRNISKNCKKPILGTKYENKFMKNIRKIYLFLCFFLCLISCSKITPKGEIELKDVSVGKFTNLDLEGNYKVFFVKGLQNLVSVETYPNIFKNLDIKVENSTLHIKENRNAEKVPFYTITIFGNQDPTSITLHNRVEFNISGLVQSPKFSLFLDGNSKFLGAVNTESAQIAMAQKTNANILGKTANLNLKLADSASIVAPYFEVENLEINEKNDAFAGINVGNEMKGTLENTSKLIFYGEPVNNLVKKDKSSVENGKLR